MYEFEAEEIVGQLRLKKFLGRGSMGVVRVGTVGNSNEQVST